MEFFSPTSMPLFDDLLVLPQAGAKTGPTGRPPNGYAVLFDDHTVLVDAACSWQRDGIRELAREGRPPEALVLSHGHVVTLADALQELRAEFDLEVLLHPADAEEVLAGIDVADPMASGRLARDRLEVLHLPGHTPGSIMLFWPAHGGVIFAGDCAVGPGPKQDRDPPRLLRPQMIDKSSDEAFVEGWQGLVRERRFRSVLPLHGQPYVDRDDILEIVERIWTEPPMDPSALA